MRQKPIRGACNSLTSFRWRSGTLDGLNIAGPLIVAGILLLMFVSGDRKRVLGLTLAAAGVAIAVLLVNHSLFRLCLPITAQSPGAESTGIWAVWISGQCPHLLNLWRSFGSLSFRSRCLVCSPAHAGDSSGKTKRRLRSAFSAPCRCSWRSMDLSPTVIFQSWNADRINSRRRFPRVWHALERATSSHCVRGRASSGDLRRYLRRGQSNASRADRKARVLRAAR